MSNWRFRRETVQILAHFGGPRCDVDFCGCFGTKPYFSWGKMRKNTPQKCPSASARFCAKMSGGVSLKTNGTHFMRIRGGGGVRSYVWGQNLAGTFPCLHNPPKSMKNEGLWRLSVCLSSNNI